VNETLTTWIESLVDSLDRLRDPFGALRRLGVMPSASDDPDGRLAVLATAWLQLMGPMTVSDAVMQIGNRIHNPGDLDTVLAEKLRALENEIARLLDSHGDDFPNCGLIPTSPFRARGLLRGVDSIGRESFSFVANIQTLPVDHWLRTALPPDELLSGSSLVLGPCEFLPVIGWREKRFYELRTALDYTRQHRAVQRDDEARVKRDMDLQRIRNEDRARQLAMPVTQADFEKLQAENAALREQIGKDTQK